MMYMLYTCRAPLATANGVHISIPSKLPVVDVLELNFASKHIERYRKKHLKFSLILKIFLLRSL